MWFDEPFMRIEVDRDPATRSYIAYAYHERDNWYLTARLPDPWLKKQPRVERFIDDKFLLTLMVAAALTRSREVPGVGPYQRVEGTRMLVA